MSGQGTRLEAHALQRDPQEQQTKLGVTWVSART